MIVYERGWRSSFDKVIALYSEAGWTNYTRDPAMLQAALKGSMEVITAWEGEELCGIVRTVGDGSSICYIQDIITAKAYRRRGVGTNLIGECLKKSSYQTVLLTDDRPDTAAFYRSLGFTEAGEHKCKAFVRFGK